MNAENAEQARLSGAVTGLTLLRDDVLDAEDMGAALDHQAVAQSWSAL